MHLPFHHHQQPHSTPIFTPTPLAGLLGHKKEVRSVAWSSDSSLLASGSEDNTARVWNLATSQPIVTLHGKDGAEVWGLAWSPTGRVLAYGTCYTNFWDAETGQHLQPLEQPEKGSVLSLAWSPDGRAIAASDDQCTISLWDVLYGTPIATLKDDVLEADEDAFHTCIWGVAWSPDGRLLASSSSGGVRLWDTQTWQVVAVLPMKFGNIVPASVAWSPDGRYLAAEGVPKTPWVSDRATGKQVHEQWTCDPYLSSTRVAWSPDGAFLVTGDTINQHLGLWDVQRGKLVRVIEGELKVNALAWSPSGQFLAAAGVDHQVGVWAMR
jgi:WD40 repeat protein